MMFDVEYLAIAVLHEYRFNKTGGGGVSRDYHEVKMFLETLVCLESHSSSLEGGFSSSDIEERKNAESFAEKRPYRLHSLHVE